MLFQAFVWINLYLFEFLNQKRETILKSSPMHRHIPVLDTFGEVRVKHNAICSSVIMKKNHQLVTARTDGLLGRQNPCQYRIDCLKIGHCGSSIYFWPIVSPLELVCQQQRGVWSENKFRAVMFWWPNIPSKNSSQLLFFVKIWPISTKNSISFCLVSYGASFNEVKVLVFSCFYKEWVHFDHRCNLRPHHGGNVYHLSATIAKWVHFTIVGNASYLSDPDSWDKQSKAWIRLHLHSK